jgi:hypothetical protein
MIGTAFGLSVVAGFFRDGFSASAVYNWGHSTLAWMAFVVGVMATSFPESASLRRNLRLGLVISGCLLVPVALIQYLDLPLASNLMELLYGGVGAEESVNRLRVGLLSNRAPGPHFAPTTFGGISLLALAVFWLVSDKTHSGQRAVMVGCSTIIILCTVSRHVFLAGFLGLVFVFVLGQIRTRLRIVVGLVVVTVAMIFLGSGLGLMESWENRAFRFKDGVLLDENIAGRVLDGPLRLLRYIEKHPMTLVTGAGLEIEKTSGRNNAVDLERTGFVSNSFLLPLYYLGIPGMLIYLSFWIWAGWTAVKLPSHQRAIPCGIVVAALIIIVSDNYAFIYEPTVAMLFIIPGLIAGARHAYRVEQIGELPNDRDFKAGVASNPEEGGPALALGSSGA